MRCSFFTHRDRLKTYSVLGLVHAEVHQPINPYFAPSVLFDKTTAEEALVSWLFFTGFLTYNLRYDANNELIPATTLCPPNKGNYEDYLSRVPCKEKEETLKKLQATAFLWEKRDEWLLLFKELM